MIIFYVCHGVVLTLKIVTSNSSVLYLLDSTLAKSFEEARRYTRSPRPSSYLRGHVVRSSFVCHDSTGTIVGEATDVPRRLGRCRDGRWCLLVHVHAHGVGSTAYFTCVPGTGPVAGGALAMLVEVLVATPAL